MTVVLDFDFDIEFGSLGTEEEAREIFGAVGDRFLHEPERVPGSWKYIGHGGTRSVYLSPSGVVYKISLDGGDDEPCSNDKEHTNFRRIKQSGRLPRGWRVPKSHLHVFTANYSRWNWETKKPEHRPGRVAVLACEYVPGKLIGGWDNKADEETQDVFEAVGLNDWHGANTIQAADGIRYIIDAAE